MSVKNVKDIYIKDSFVIALNDLHKNPNSKVEVVYSQEFYNYGLMRNVYNEKYLREVPEVTLFGLWFVYVYRCLL